MLQADNAYFMISDDRSTNLRKRARGAAREGSRIIHVATSGVRTPVAISRLRDAADAVLRSERVLRAEMSIALVTSRQMAALNKKHLQHSGPTDVITFALAPTPHGALQADIYICADVARDQAKTHRCGVREEILRLVVHGALHACGYDHPTDETRATSQMWRRQEQLLMRILARSAA